VHYLALSASLLSALVGGSGVLFLQYFTLAIGTYFVLNLSVGLSEREESWSERRWVSLWDGTAEYNLQNDNNIDRCVKTNLN